LFCKAGIAAALAALVWCTSIAHAQEEAAEPATAGVAVAEAVVEETTDEAPAKPWADMTVEEKIEALAGSAMQVDDESGVASGSLYGEINALWTCLAAFLVFFMQAGFAAVEAGFTRAKNTCNIIMKNLMDFSAGTIIFWAVGFGLMFGTTNGFFGTTDFLFDAAKESPDDVAFGWAFLLFQTVFCATAATIVSGAMAERTKFSSYLLYTIGITAIVYPIFGSWGWGSLWHGEGWLEGMGFHDFAGSTVVHSIGGWAALAGALVVGPRIGKFVNGKPMPIPGHNIPLAALGVFILWLGWFGFNPGSTTAVGGGDFAFIAVTTNVAAAGGAIAAMIVSWLLFKKPDVSFALNGALAGLVAITAGCDVIPVPFALLTGFIAGGVVVLSCLFFDRIGVDDPVGAVSVHGVCGALGTLCTGLFAAEEGLLLGGGTALITTQAIGVAAAFAWAFTTSGIIFLAIKYTFGLRVSDVEQLEGLDVHEHGMSAYPVGWIAVSETAIGSRSSGFGATSGMGAPAPVGSPAMAT
jgi:Amt family ammonium transporter